MTSEKSKMLAGALYNASDPELLADRRKALSLCQSMNALDSEASPEQKRRLLKALLAPSEGPATVDITAPFHCDYGFNIVLGENVYFNFNCVVLDVCRVTIGHRALFGPGVQIYTASHPLSLAERRSGLELGYPVTIEDDVWVGGGAIICPGVTIGQGSVIGAGSVVTRDVPAGVLAAGNPCRVIRSL